MSEPAYPPLLDRFVVVLVEPQIPLNIGTVVRAMKNMGLTRLRLVNPKHDIDYAEIQVSAHRTTDIVEVMEVHDDIDSALESVHRVVGMTARMRSRRWDFATPRGRAPGLLQLATEGRDVALVFGREHAGLTNLELERCDEFLTIPTRADYTSLNLSQAVLLVSSELFLAASDESVVAGLAPTHAREVAPVGDRARLLGQILHTLDATGFFKSKARGGVEHGLGRVLSRAQPDVAETRMMTGIFVDLIKFVDRVRNGWLPDDLPPAIVPEVPRQLAALVSADDPDEST